MIEDSRMTNQEQERPFIYLLTPSTLISGSIYHVSRTRNRVENDLAKSVITGVPPEWSADRCRSVS